MRIARRDQPGQEHRRQAEDVVRAEEPTDDGERERAQKTESDVGAERGEEAGLLVRDGRDRLGRK